MKPIGQEMWSQSPPGTSLFMSSGKFGELFSAFDFGIRVNKVWNLKTDGIFGSPKMGENMNY